MRIRSYLGILLAAVLVVAAGYLTNHNREVLYQPFRLNPQTSVPLWAVLIAVFLLGFLPTVTILTVQTLRRDLKLRKERRARRAVQGLEAAYRRAVDLAADGQWAKALAELEPVVAAEPEDYGALLAYGEALRHAGRAGEAVAVHRRAAVAYPQSLAVLYELADDYAAAGDAQVAREVRDRALRDFPGLGLAVLRRRRGRALGERDFAEAARLHGAIEALLRDAGDPEGLAAEAPLGLGLAYERGVALLEAENVEEAEREFRQVLAQDASFVPAAIMLGEALLVRDDAAGALAEWRRGWESTGSPVFLQRIEDHFIERAEPERAIETLRGVIAAARQGDVLPRFLLGRLYYRLEMHDEALRVLEPLADHMATAPTYHFLLGRIHERRGEMRRSVESYHASCRELGVDAVDYACRFCGAKSADWSDRCAACGSWNSVELNFRAERATPVGDDRGAAVMGSYDGPEYT